VVSAVSAAIAAFSSWNSLRSAQASRAVVRETRRQREIDNARSELALLGHVWDDTVSFMEALSTQHRSDRTNLENRRAVLRRSIMVAGINRPSLERLAAATDPLTPPETAAVLADLQERSAALHQIMTDDSSTGKPESSGQDSNAG
jgi:hypothetical protein